MKKTFPLLEVTISALLITWLFHKQHLGLNVILFESIFYLWLIFSRRVSLSSYPQMLFGALSVITGVFSVINYSHYTYTMHFMVLGVFVGALAFNNAKSPLNLILQSLSNVFSGPHTYFRLMGRSKVRNRNLGSYLRRSRIFFIPALIVVVFVMIYRGSNPIFKQWTIDFGAFINDKIFIVFKDFDGFIILTFLLALIISAFLLIHKKNKRIIDKDSNAADILFRTPQRKVGYFKLTALKNEYRAGVFLFLVLNLLILTLNISDLRWVWFGFEWEGQFLKNYVHEGTYLLIVSILISIALVLFYFRKNLNFYKQNKLLKFLSYIWIAQNTLLTISVALRNYRYIEHYALAYKRIGVAIFLILTVIGLYTVLIKVIEKKSTFYLLKTNAYAIIIVLAMSSLINWDVFIAKYNLRHSDTAFLHLEFMSQLSDKALPYLDMQLEEIERIEVVQQNRFSFKRNYLTPEKYHNIIRLRKEDFKNKWKNKTYKEWNLAEKRAYDLLFTK